MINSLISTAVKTGAAGGLGSALIGSSAGTFGTVATVVAAPWFVPVAIVSGVVLGGLAARERSLKEIKKVNSYFD